MKVRRTRIPTLDEVIDKASPEDFRLLTSALSERTPSPEELGAAQDMSRPDLVPILVRSGAGLVPRMTRRKVFNGKIRKRVKKR